VRSIEGRSRSRGRNRPEILTDSVAIRPPALSIGISCHGTISWIDSCQLRFESRSPGSSANRRTYATCVLVVTPRAAALARLGRPVSLARLRCEGGSPTLKIAIRKEFAGRGPEPDLKICCGNPGQSFQINLWDAIDKGRWPVKGYTVSGTVKFDTLEAFTRFSEPEKWKYIALQCE
jgi:hypothetical protein